MLFKEIEVDLSYPLEGIDETRSFLRQRALTSVDEMNVRSFDPGTDRARGGSRHGLSKFFPTTAVGVFPIQDITHLVTNDVGTPSASIGQFIYSKGLSNGFALGAGANGTSLWSSGAGANFIFANSCWDQAGNCYVGEVNQSTGAIVVYRLAASGTGTAVWVQNTLKVATGTNRNVCGMVVIGTNLYVAVNGAGGTGVGQGTITGATNATPIVITSANHRLTNGMTVTVSSVGGNTAANGAFVVTVLSPTTFSLNGSAGNGNYTTGGAWVSTQSVIYQIDTATGQTVANYWNTGQNNYIVFSINAINCLGALGTVLGVECFGTGNNSFVTFDTAGASSNVNQFSYAVTASARRSMVLSDGVAYFYVLGSSTTSIIRKFNSGASQIWASTALDGQVPQGLAFDLKSGKLVAVSNIAPSAVVLSLTDGTSVTTANPGGITAWNTVDSDWLGNFTFWRDSVASNDILGTNASFSVIWGPSTFANTKHGGAQVNKGAQNTTPSSGSRQIRNLLVSNGEVRLFDTTAATAITGGSGALSPSSTAPQIFSSPCNLNMFYVDGTVYRYYESSSNSVKTWAGGPGTLPLGVTGTARLIETWRGRIVLAGIRTDPLNYFMSAQLAPFNFDYSPPITTTTQAVAGNNSPAGLVGDIINCMIPYTDDVMVFGCSHSIWQMVGDPADGGQLTVATHGLGMIFGRPWAIDPVGQIYFMGTDRAVYKLVPGATPVRISQQITRRLQLINTDPSVNRIRMVWDQPNQGLLVVVTPITAGSTQNFFWEERTNAWHPMTFANTNHDSMAVHLLENDDPAVAKILFGGRDGFVRQWLETATTDDGTTIASFVFLGPVPNKQDDDQMLKDLESTVAAGAATITYAVYTGNSPESALASSPVVTGTLAAGSNWRQHIRRSGVVIYVKISATSAWALERIICRVAGMGRIRSRNIGI